MPTPLQLPYPVPFPEDLPLPDACTLQPAARAAVSSLDGGAKAQRPRIRDRIQKASVSWSFSFSQHSVFVAWLETNSQRRVSIPLPGAGGVLPRSCRFIGEPTDDSGAGLGWRVSASVEIS